MYRPRLRRISRSRVPARRQALPLAAGGAVLGLGIGVGTAQETPTSVTLPPMTVTAPSSQGPLPLSKTLLSPSPDALPAETTTIGAQAIAETPVTSYGDIFRPLTGFDVSNYGQGGLGYGLSLRGFTDEEHGRDIAYFIDGVPINEVSSIHTPNYADLNVLVPETIERIDVIRGPFSAEYGDSALGGVVDITTKTGEPFGMAGFSGGSFDTFRGIATYSQAPAPGATNIPFLAFEGYSTDGYRNNSEYQRFNLFAKDTIILGQDQQLSVRSQIYGGEWGAAGYISRDLIKEHQLSPTAATDPSDGGNKYLENLVANYRQGSADEPLTATIFVSHDNFTRYSDFGGGESGQLENRATFGGSTKKVWGGDFLTLPAQISVGGNFRGDNVNVLALPTIGRNQSGPESVNLHFNEYAAGLFSELQVKPVDWLKLTFGGRYDQLFYNLRNRLDPLDSPTANPGLASPKVGAAITPVRWLEVFTNYGTGFRSPDAVSDLTVNDKLGPLTISSEEVGVRFLPVDGASLLVDAWRSDISDEVFQAAPGLPPQNLGASERHGFDFEAKYDVLRDDIDRLTVFANIGTVQARLEDQGIASYVPDVPAYTANAGVQGGHDLGAYGRLVGSLTVALIGRKSLTEDAILKSHAYERISAKASWELQSGWSAFAEAIAYPGDRLSEIAINLGPNTGAATSDIATSPMPTFTGLLGVAYRFNTGT